MTELNQTTGSLVGPPPTHPVITGIPPHRYVRPIPREELARILGELDEAAAVRGDEPDRLELGVGIACIVLAVLVVGYFVWQFLR